MYTYLTLSYSSKISRPTARTSRDAYNLAHRIRGGSVSSIFARLSACRYTMRYISVIPVACHPSISAERTVKRGSRGANLIYLSQVPSASPPFLLPFAPRGSSTWYPWYTCISFSAPLRRFLDPLSLSPPLSTVSNQILPLSFSLVPSSITYRSLFSGVPCKEGRKGLRN